MQITNFNFYTFFIFIVWIGFILFFLYKSIQNQIDFNKNHRLLASNKYFYIKYICLFLSLFIAFLSIFWIQYGEKLESMNSKWIDIIFTLDVSKSMNVADFKDDNYYYTRLDLIKKSIAEFISKHSENRYWLVIFAGEAVSSVPLTDDNELFLTFLDGVDYKNLLKQWSDFESAFDLWVERFTDEKRSKVMIFISDGWENDDSINSEKIKKISKKIPGIQYFVVWVWSSEWWKIIEWQDVFWRYIYQSYNGQEVISKINIPNLKEIARSIGADFIQINDKSEMEKLSDSIEKLNKTVLKKSVSWELADAGRFLSIISFLFFLLFLWLYLFNNRLWKRF